MRNHSYENAFRLIAHFHVNKTTEAQGDSEMTYCLSQRFNVHSSLLFTSNTMTKQPRAEHLFLRLWQTAELKGSPGRFVISAKWNIKPPVKSLQDGIKMY